MTQTNLSLAPTTSPIKKSIYVELDGNHSIISESKYSSKKRGHRRSGSGSKKISEMAITRSTQTETENGEIENGLQEESKPVNKVSLILKAQDFS